MAADILESAELAKETLIPLREAAPYFPAKVSRGWLEKMIRTGSRGVRLETFFFCNKRYTSKEAIQRFLEQTQKTAQPKPEPPRRKRMSEAEITKGLRKFGLPDPE